MPKKGSSRVSQGDAAQEFGALLRDFRLRKNVSQITLATELRRSSSFVSLLESGNRAPSKEVIEEIGTILVLLPSEIDRLFLAAGYAVDDTGRAVQELSDSVTPEHLRLTPQHVMFASDVQDLADYWKQMFAAIELFNAADFAQAKSEFEKLLSHYRQRSVLGSIAASIHYAKTLIHCGNLSDASTALNGAQKEIDAAQAASGVTPPWLEEPALRGELVATHAEIALRHGNYPLAKELTTRSFSMYQQAFMKQSQATLFGLGMSNKRLAQVALFQGEARDAINFCKNAESYFKQILPSSLADLWIARVGELHAWALTQLRRFDDALKQRNRNRQTYERLHAPFQLAKNALFMADDYRKRFEDLLKQRDTTVFVSPKARAEHIRTTLNAVESDLQEADTLYQFALQELRVRDAQILIGRCQRGLGIIRRFRAVFQRAPDEMREEAMELLRNAYATDAASGQKRRLPGIYEVLAEIAWDQDHLQEAGDHYYAAMTIVEQLLQESGDLSLKIHHAHFVEMLALLREREIVPTASGEESVRQILPQWSTQIRAMKEILYKALLLGGGRTRFITNSERDEKWLQTINETEMRPGSRRLLQNALSSSLTTKLPEGSTPIWPIYMSSTSMPFAMR